MAVDSAWDACFSRAPAQLSAALGQGVTGLPPPTDACAWQVLATAFGASWFCNQGSNCEPGAEPDGEDRCQCPRSGTRPL